MDNIVLYSGAYSGPKVDEAVSRALTGGAIDQSIAALRGAVGSPLVAATAADMTDTSNVYVYTGSEAGYSAGNWYYWDGAAWTSGGVYNAVAVNTDTTLSVPGMAADAKATGDAIAAIDVDEINRRILAAFPAETDDGAVAFTAVGADGIPPKAFSVSSLGDYAVEPAVYLAPSGTHAVTAQSTANASPRCIVFPCVGAQSYTITVPVSTTLRAGSFAAYPAVGDTPNKYATATGTTVTITPNSGDKWILVQLLIDNSGVTFAAAVGAGFGIAPAPVWVTQRVHRCGKNIAPAATLPGYWTTSGTLTVSAGASHTPYVRVVAGATYTWSVSVANANHSYMVWYDKDFNMISVGTASKRLDAGETSVTVTAPTGAAYASLSYRTGQTALQFERAASGTAIEAYSEVVSVLTIADGSLAPELTTVLGPNSVWADSGDVSVTFCCDPALYLAQ